MQYDIILFDLGNVVFKVDFTLCCKYWEKILGFDVTPYFDKFRTSPLNVEFEKADITPREYYKGLIADLKIDLSFENFVAGFNQLYKDAYPDVTAEIKRLAGSVKIVALTNTNEIHSAVWPNKYKDVLQYFDAIYSSSELHMAKPDPEIYRYVLKDLGTDPSHVLYFDDLKENVDAARELGIKSCLITNPNDVCKELQKITTSAR